MRSFLKMQLISSYPLLWSIFEQFPDKFKLWIHRIIPCVRKDIVSVVLNGLTSLIVFLCFLVSVFSERIVKVLLEHFA